jgi:hypothetical protein
VFKAKEREYIIHHVKREIIIFYELDASSDSSFESYLPGSHIFRGCRCRLRGPSEVSWF